MKNYTRAQLMAGAAAIPLEVALETKDANIGVPELKSAVEELGRTITEFRAKNDQAIAELKAGREDVLTKTDLEKINKAIDDAVAKFKSQADELEAKANRLQLGGAGAGADAAKQAAEFAKIIGRKDFTPDQLREYKTALEENLRFPDRKAATLQVGADPNGGYWVTPDKTGRIVKKVYETTAMRKLANVVSIGTDMLEGPIDNDEAEALWAGETTQRGQTEIPKTGMWKIEVKELYAYPFATQRLLEDATIDVEGWLADKVSGRFSRRENAGFINGDGVLQPRGLLTYGMVTTADDTRPWGSFQIIKTGADGGFGAGTNGTDKLLELIFELKDAYRQRGKFLMSRRTNGGVRKLKDGDGNYAYGVSLQDGALVESVFGYTVTNGEDMPTYTTADAHAIAFGDFNEAYTIVDRLGITVIRDNITKPGFVKWHMRKRVGGGAVNFESVKFLSFGD